MPDKLLIDAEIEGVRQQREADCHGRFGPWAVTSLVLDGSRIYAVTHIRTGMKCHPGDFGDGLAAIECAKELALTFPQAGAWTGESAKADKENKARVHAIVDRHREHDAWCNDEEVPY